MAAFVGLGMAPNIRKVLGTENGEIVVSELGQAIEVSSTFNDLDIDETGNLRMVYDAEAVGQHVRQRLLAWKNDWFLNPEAGIDWTRYVLGRSPAEREIAEATIKREILTTPGVVSILAFESEYDRRSRGLRLTKVILQTVFDDTVDLEL